MHSAHISTAFSVTGNSPCVNKKIDRLQIYKQAFIEKVDNFFSFSGYCEAD